MTEPIIATVNKVNERFYRNRENLFESLTDFCQQTLEKACVENGNASFMVSGGSTPAPLYQRLSRRVMSWQKIDVALVDERWVEPDDENSNQRFIKNTLLQHNASDVRFTGLKTSQPSAEQGLSDATKDYESLPNPWDLTILGMGADGHTASIFPDAQGTEEALREDHEQILAAIIANPSEVTGDNLERMTLSHHGLMKSKRIVLLITGEEKLDVYRQALNEPDHNKMPISAVLQQNQVPLHVFWAP
ncbi:MAG: 6-phosphogluconolactonase [Algicola sp.]|nr:6-phosphogluconolactonase [Algicola sp.]